MLLIDLAKMAKIHKFGLANSLLDSPMATWLTLTVTLNLFRTRELGFVENEDYRSHTRSLFYQWKTFGIYDIVNFNSMVFMFKVYANLLPSNLLSFFKSE